MDELLVNDCTQEDLEYDSSSQAIPDGWTQIVWQKAFLHRNHQVKFSVLVALQYLLRHIWLSNLSAVCVT